MAALCTVSSVCTVCTVSRSNSVLPPGARASRDHAADSHRRIAQVLQHKYATRVAAHARIVRRHAVKLLEDVAIACSDYADRHQVGLPLFNSIASQKEDSDTGGVVMGTGIINVTYMAIEMAEYATGIASAADPAPLSSD